jgi:hypothetical protein
MKSRKEEMTLKSRQEEQTGGDHRNTTRRGR